MPTKTYVLLEHTKPSANVYIQINKNQRVPLNSRRLDRPALQIPFTDKNGVGKTLRLKLAAKSIYMDEQIEAKILANEKFAQREYEIITFRHGWLIVKNELVQKFLDAHPENELFWIKDEKGEAGSCDEIKQPLFKEYSKTTEVLTTNKWAKKKYEAVKRVMELADLAEGQALMIKLNGSWFTPPDSLEEIQNQLLDWIDATDEAGMDSIIRKNYTVDEDATELVASAMRLGILSFDKVPGQAVKVKGKNTINLKEVPKDYNEHDKQRYFIDFLLSDAGKVFYDDLKKDVGELEKKKAA